MLLRYACVLVLVCVLSDIGLAQSRDPLIEEILSEVRLDSLVLTIRELSGDTTTTVGDSTVRIVTRRAGTDGNSMAAKYLRQRLQSFGLQTYEDQYSSSGNNIYAIQTGVDFPEVQYVICAHYDDQPPGSVAPGADDNASGTAAVVEAARVLSKVPTRYSIVYALWDEEEIGLIGSGSYASRAGERRDSIRGAINIDMIGWDGNADSLLEIHTRAVAHSRELGDTIAHFNSLYGIGAKIAERDPGAGASDHSSFWGRAYSAVLMIEGYQTGDFNPYYHSTQDDLTRFSLPYFEMASRLAIGSLAMLSSVTASTPVEEPASSPRDFRLAQNFPNPFNPSTEIGYRVAVGGHVRLAVYDLLGREAAVLVDELKAPGSYQARLNATGLASGVYLYRLTAGDFVQTRKMTLVR